MNRRHFGVAATALLLLLTLSTWGVYEAELGAAGLAALALLKVLVIGAVFLELDRSWPIWGLGLLVLTSGVLGGAVLLMGAG
jgi:hypothetical protein